MRPGRRLDAVRVMDLCLQVFDAPVDDVVRLVCVHEFARCYPRVSFHPRRLSLGSRQLIFRLDNVGLKYPRSDTAVLSGLSLNIDKNEFVGIVGPTACGKSSLLKILSGVIPHFENAEMSSSVEIFGEPPVNWTLARLSRKVGLVMEDPEDQLFNLRVQDEVTWALENHGLPADEIRRRSADALRFFGIEHL